MKAKDSLMVVMFLGFSLMLLSTTQASLATTNMHGGEICLECHKAEANVLMGEWEHVAMKSATIQMKAGERVEILTFDKGSLKLANTPDKSDTEKMLRSIKEGSEVTVRFVEKNGVKVASAITVKPPVKVAAREMIKQAELEKLIARGPEKGGYLLVDSRPAGSFRMGAIPTAVNIPFTDIAKKGDLLPKVKKLLLVFYGDNDRSRMGTVSMKRVKAMGYRNVKLFAGGMDGWMARNSGVVDAKALEDCYGNVPHLLLDTRPREEAAKGFIRGAAAFPAGNVDALKSLPKKDLKAPIIVYDEDEGGNAAQVAAAMVKAGQSIVMVLAGGYAAAKTAGLPIDSGVPSISIKYVPSPKPGSFPMDNFISLIEAVPAGTLLLDVRNGEELKEGTIKGTMNIPVQELFHRAKELPRDKRVIAYCNSGARAEMAYHILKDKGFNNIYFLKAHVDYDNGEPDIY